MTALAPRVEWFIPEMPPPLSPYTHVVTAGDLVFVTACAPVDGNRELVGRGDITAQAIRVHENLKAYLAHVGSDFASVLKVTVYVGDMADRVAVNEVRKRYFGHARPASTLVEVPGFALDGVMVEMEAVAVVPRSGAGEGHDG